MNIGQILEECAGVAARCCASAVAAPETDVTTDLAFPTPWSTDAQRQLSVTYRCRAQDTTSLSVCVNDDSGSIHVDLAAPRRLMPLTVSKPWGEEIWFTGIEERGECAVQINQTTLPLASFLALAPAKILGEHTLPLLKILAPKPDSVNGDLYIEAHSSKSELYIVSDIDDAAWPDGSASLLLGMNQSKRHAYANDDAYRTAYLEATQRYEQTRRAIDAGQSGQTEIEKEQRLEVRSFFHEHRVTLDSVVWVPPLFPHSLQHGVRVVECQTPVFERYILSFWQRVATQSHWDTGAATPLLDLDTPPNPGPTPVSEGLTEIGRFDAFSLYRMAAGTSMTLQPANSCRLFMSMRGESRIADLVLAHEEAAFLPACATCEVRAPDDGYLLFLCATSA
ncbi:MAG: hypothetical protein NXH85_18390 [Pseudomonadaceae bacterium]|nr:hypothetical protein [Pseudomonadaceae bacterium]